MEHRSNTGFVRKLMIHRYKIEGRKSRFVAKFRDSLAALMVIRTEQQDPKEVERHDNKETCENQKFGLIESNGQEESGGTVF